MKNYEDFEDYFEDLENYIESYKNSEEKLNYDSIIENALSDLFYAYGMKEIDFVKIENRYVFAMTNEDLNLVMYPHVPKESVK